MKKKLIVTGLVATGVLGTAILAPITAFAQASDTGDTFVSKLAAALGIEETQVQTAVESVRDDMHAERQAELTAAINQAVTDGELTQRQADILLTMQTIREAEMANREESPPAEPDESLTEEERRVEMETRRAEHEQEMLAALNASGLNTTQEEVKAANEAARDAGLKILRMGRGGPGGHGMGLRP